MPVLDRMPSHQNAPEAIRSGGLSLRVCEECGFGFALEQVSSSELDFYYRQSYWQTVHERRSVPHRRFTPLDPRPASQLALMRMYKQIRVGDALLDVGPGAGSSFHSLNELVPGLRLFAFEPDAISAVALRNQLGVTVFNSPFPAQPMTRDATRGESFDVILLSHVLEHFNGRDVVQVLTNARSLLKPHGLLVCEVPHSALERGAQEVGSDPSHLSFFTAMSLGAAITAAQLTTHFIDTCGDLISDHTNNPAPGSGGGPVWAGRLRAAYLAGVAHRLPARAARTLHSLAFPNNASRLLRSSNFDYGGDRSWLRAIASSAPIGGEDE